jgi:Protein of unknown function (DUF4038)
MWWAFTARLNRAGAAVIGLGTGIPAQGVAAGKIGVWSPGVSSTRLHLAVDVSGYFMPAALQQWREWEQTLVSPVDYLASGVDPYGDIDLNIRFNGPNGQTFLQGAFWDLDEEAPRIFKVRSALPPGDWTWQIESCDNQGVSCLSGWSPSSGSVHVQPSTNSGNPLYDHGPLTQPVVTSLGQLVGYSHIQYADGGAFHWVGDTAGTAPAREYDPPGSRVAQTDSWESFTADRAAKGFTVLQIAPAVTWQPTAADDETWFPLPSASGFSFRRPRNYPVTPCAAVATIPGSVQLPGRPRPTQCWEPIPQYLTHLHAMVRDANEKGMTVAIVGVMNPTGIPTAGTYPDEGAATQFARVLAKTMAARMVVYSPAFDDDPDEIDGPDSGGGARRRVLMNAVGNALHSVKAAWRKPLTNHLAGGLAHCDEYREFSQSGWMSFYMFQSGHGASNPADLLGDCAPKHGADDVLNAMQRAREMSLTLDAYTNPALPAVNAEGPYDKENYLSKIGHPAVDTRYRVRQGCYYSALSNAVGCSYGSHGFSIWDDPPPFTPGPGPETPRSAAVAPASFLALDSSFDMEHFGTNLLNKELAAHPEWIKNNEVAGVPRSDKYQMVLATEGTELILAYLPGDQDTEGDSSPEIWISRSELDFEDLACSGWSFTWKDPTTNDPRTGSGCATESTYVKVARPACLSTNPSCDWLLEIERIGSRSGSGSASTSVSLGSTSAAPSHVANRVVARAWNDASPADGTAGIYATLFGLEGESESILVSPGGRAFQRRPRAASLGGSPLLVWQADGLDGSLNGIFGARIDPVTLEASDSFKINSYTEHDQSEPAVATADNGEAMVVWSSYGQDGDRGGLYGRLLSTEPLSDDYLRREVQVTGVSAGHQQRPQIRADSGGFWVAWETLDDNNQISSLSVRRVRRDGQPVGTEIRIAAPAGEQLQLLTLDTPGPGSVGLRWWRLDSRGRFLGKAGQRVGPEEPIGPVEGH